MREEPGRNARTREQPLAARLSQVAEARRRWRAPDPIPRDKVFPNAAAIEALYRTGDDALLRERERWRPVLERILALSNELHPATRDGLKAEAQRLWQRLELGPIPAIPKSERAILRQRITALHRRKHGR